MMFVRYSIVYSPGDRFSKVPKSFRSQKAMAQSQTCFIHIFLEWTEVPFIQEVPGAYASQALDTDKLKMA